METKSFQKYLEQRLNKEEIATIEAQATFERDAILMKSYFDYLKDTALLFLVLQFIYWNTACICIYMGYREAIQLSSYDLVKDAWIIMVGCFTGAYINYKNKTDIFKDELFDLIKGLIKKKWYTKSS